jgi:hypothetical protein
MPNILRKLAHLNINRALRTQARAIIIRNYFEPNKQASPWALTGHDAQQTETAGLNIHSTDQEAVEARQGRAVQDRSWSWGHSILSVTFKCPQFCDNPAQVEQNLAAACQPPLDAEQRSAMERQVAPYVRELMYYKPS